jgi:hypothetical protein
MHREKALMARRYAKRGTYSMPDGTSRDRAMAVSANDRGALGNGAG